MANGLFSDLIGKGELTGEDLNSFIFVDRPIKRMLFDIQMDPLF